MTTSILAAESSKRLISNLTYGNEELQNFDVYLPDSKKSPVLIFVHGGAWRTGDKLNRNHSKKGLFFAKKGFLFVSINYRLSPQVQHPTHSEDVAKAFAHVFNNCHKWGGNKKRMYLMGHSAGAHLVALLTTKSQLLQQHGLSNRHISGTVLLDGAGYDIPFIKRFNPWSFRRLYEQAFGTNEQTLLEASPINYSSQRGVAPMLILHVNRRMAKYQSEQLGNALQQGGNRATVRMVPGKSHRTINSEIGNNGDEPTEWILAFFEEHKNNHGWRRR